MKNRPFGILLFGRNTETLRAGMNDKLKQTVVSHLLNTNLLCAYL